jgi:hypothetical protein
MIRPRLSIAWLIVCVLVAAFDLAVLSGPNSDWAWLNLIALPMVNVLVLAHTSGRMRRRRGDEDPFLLGFQVAGWAALIAYLAWCRVRPEPTAEMLAVASEWIHWTVLDNLSFDAMQRLDPTFALAWKISMGARTVAVSAALTAAMLLIASSGGMIVRRGRRSIARHSPKIEGALDLTVAVSLVYIVSTDLPQPAGPLLAWGFASFAAWRKVKLSAARSEALRT